MSEKLKTITMSRSGSSVTSEDPEFIFDEIRFSLDDVEDENDRVTITLVIEKTKTREDLDNMPEFDGF